jgi:hypothetical protein
MVSCHRMASVTVMVAAMVVVAGGRTQARAGPRIGKPSKSCSGRVNRTRPAPQRGATGLPPVLAPGTETPSVKMIPQRVVRRELVSAW